MSQVTYTEPVRPADLLDGHATSERPTSLPQGKGVLAATRVLFVDDRFRFDNGLTNILLGVPRRDVATDAHSRLLGSRTGIAGVAEVTGGPRARSEMVLIDAHQPYEVAYAPRRTPTFDFLYLCPDWLADVATQMTEKPARSLDVRSSLRCRDPSLQASAEACLAASLSSETSPLARDTLAHHLAVRLLARHANGLPPARVRTSPLPLPMLSRLQGHVDAHLQDGLRLKEMAQLCGLPVHRFLRSFARSTGLTPHRYVLRARIERAIQLLQHSDEPIAGIAADTGFANQSHLTRTLRRHTGRTPAELRTARSRRH